MQYKSIPSVVMMGLMLRLGREIGDVRFSTDKGLKDYFTFNDEDIKRCYGTKGDGKRYYPSWLTWRTLEKGFRELFRQWNDDSQRPLQVARETFAFCDVELPGVDFDCVDTTTELLSILGEFYDRKTPPDFPWQLKYHRFVPMGPEESVRFPEGGRTRWPDGELVGRPFLVSRVEDAMARPGTSVVSIIGGLGTGKTELVASLGIDASLYCEHDGPIASTAVLICALEDVLARLLKFPGNKKHKPSLPVSSAPDNEGEFVCRFLDVLRTARKPNGRFAIAVDGIDELGDADMFVSLVISHAEELPDWFTLVMTMRPESYIAAHLPSDGDEGCELIMMEDDEQVDADIFGFCRAQGLSVEEAERVTKASSGLFLAASLLCDWVRIGIPIDSGDISGRALDSVYASLVAIAEIETDNLDVLLGLIQAAPGIPRVILESALSWSPRFAAFDDRPCISFPVAQRHLSALVDFGESAADAVVPRHDSFRSWLSTVSDAYVCHDASIQGRLVAACKASLTDTPVSAYAAEHFYGFALASGMEPDLSMAEIEALIAENDMLSEDYADSLDFERALRCAESALRAYRMADRPFIEVGAAYFRAALAANHVDLARCIELCNEGIETVTSHRLQRGMCTQSYSSAAVELRLLAKLAMRLAMTLSRMNDMAGSDEAYARAYRSYLEMGDKVSMTEVLRQWANSHGKEPGDAEKAFALAKIEEAGRLWGGDLAELKKADEVQYVLFLVDHATHLHLNGRTAEAREALAEAEDLIEIDGLRLELRDYSQIPLVRCRIHRALGADDPLTAALAEKDAEEALRLKRKLYGDRSAEAATCLNELAHVYVLQGRNDDALRLFYESLGIRERVYGVGSTQAEYCRTQIGKVKKLGIAKAMRR